MTVVHNRNMIVLASQSAARQRLLRNAGVEFISVASRIDELAMRDAMTSERAKARDIADALAEAKARKVSQKYEDGLIIGADQVLDLDGELLEKAETAEVQKMQLAHLSGKRHRLITAVVVYEGNRPLWRHVSVASLTMRSCSDQFLDSYVRRNWPQIGSCLGGYMIEGEGVRLFSHIGGDIFSIQGLPLVELLSWMASRGAIAS